jgi:hypothetical protein
MAQTILTARRVAQSVPIWNILASGALRRTCNVGTLTNLPRERAWCLTANYCGRLLDYRAATREAVLLALRCAVDAIDHHAEQDEPDEYIEDEDGEIAAMRAAENRADAWASLHAHEEPIF